MEDISTTATEQFIPFFLLICVFSRFAVNSQFLLVSDVDHTVECDSQLHVSRNGCPTSQYIVKSFKSAIRSSLEKNIDSHGYMETLIFAISI